MLRFIQKWKLFCGSTYIPSYPTTQQSTYFPPDVLSLLTRQQNRLISIIFLSFTICIITGQSVYSISFVYLCSSNNPITSVNSISPPFTYTLCCCGGHERSDFSLSCTIICFLCLIGFSQHQLSRRLWWLYHDDDQHLTVVIVLLIIYVSLLWFCRIFKVSVSFSFYFR